MTPPRILPEAIGGSRIVADYLAGSGSAPSLFAGSPAELSAYQDRLDAVRARFDRPARERVARAVTPTSDGARERLERFVEDGGAVVTTGQQAGLFTGPLYTIYKALTAIRLAERLEGALGVVVLPVFWVASEDHDWAEVNHAFLPTPAGDLRRVGWNPPAHPPTVPMSHRALGDDVGAVVDEVTQLVDGSPYADYVLKSIRAEYRPGETVAAAFRRMVVELFAGFDLLVTDAAHPEVKAGSVDVLREALRGAAAHEEVLRRRTARLERAGYPAQVAVLDGATNVFHTGAGGRERMYRADGGFRVAGVAGAMSAGEALDELERHPGRFSPNVLLRPVVESAVFPTLAYVGGPGEIGYFAQLGALFPEFGMEPPIVYPRASFTLVERPVERVLGKLGLTEAELRRPADELRKRLAKELVPGEVTEELTRLREELTGGYARLIDAAARIDPGLAGPLGAVRNDALAGLDDGERKVLGRVKAKEAVRFRQLDRALAALRPLGQPQDRVLNVVPFLARHGPGLLTAIAEAIEVPAWEAAAAAVVRPVLGGGG